MKRGNYLALLACIAAASFNIVGCNDKKADNVIMNDAPEDTTENILEDIPEETDESRDDKEEVSDTSEIIQNTAVGFMTEYCVEDAKDGYFIVSKLDGALYGLLDSYGSEILPVEYDKISFPKSKEARAVIAETEGKVGVVDYSGNEILPWEYDSIGSDSIKGTFYLAEKDGVQSIIELDGTVYKELKGTYDYIIANNFLTRGYNTTISSEVYDFDEQLLFSDDTASANGSYAYELEGVNGYMEIYRGDSMDLMDAQGNIILSYPGAKESEGYGIMEAIGQNNLIAIQYFPNGVVLSGPKKLVNIAEKNTSELYYSEITGNKEGAFALSINNDKVNVDVYDSEGQLENTIKLGAESAKIENGNSLIAAKYGETYRMYDKTGKEVSDERYLSAEPIESFWILENLDGKYGLMDSSGEMRINFGEMGEDSYNGSEWEETYVFDNIFCIVTEKSTGSNVWLF